MPLIRFAMHLFTTMPRSPLVSDLFLLFINHNKCTTHITMRVLTQNINTITLPHTYGVLKKSLPSILASDCYNNEQLPFSKEVKQTEIGHLFEHILLEYLCILKMSQGHDSATFRGKTSWNWKKDKFGTFRIKINAGQTIMPLFKEALQKSTYLLETIMYP